MLIPTKPDGPIVGAVKQAQQRYLELRHQGVSGEDAAAEIEPVLREALGRGSLPPRCDACLDYGWIEHGRGRQKCTACRYWLRRAEEHRTEQTRRGTRAEPGAEPGAAGRVTPRASRGWSA